MTAQTMLELGPYACFANLRFVGCQAKSEQPAIQYSIAKGKSAMQQTVTKGLSMPVN